MEEVFPLAFAVIVGFTHAFEADHLVAVSNIVTRRDEMSLAVKDGIYWGLGHSSTILLIGMIVILGRAAIADDVFAYLEAGVGVMLILLGLWRLAKTYQMGGEVTKMMEHDHGHRLAYGVGLVHGLAGSGALILLVLANGASTWHSLVYLLLFGLGSVGGMLLAAGVLGLPFTKSVLRSSSLQLVLILLSSLLCISYGGYVLYENLIV